MAAWLGKQIAHSNYVDVRNIRACFSQCGEYRYLLTIPYNSEEDWTEVISVILKNPSSAEEKCADGSVRRVEEYVHRNFPQCRELRILNLFAYRATKVEELQARISQEGFDSAVGPGNDRFLRTSFCNSTRIIAAWGDPGKIDKALYRCRVEQVHQLLQPYAERLLKVVSPYPRHALKWDYEYQCRSYPLTALTNMEN